MEILKPYRARIDALDAELIALLRQRFDIIEEVGHLKAAHSIAPILPDRVEAVRENAAKMGEAAGMDGDMLRKIWTLLIDEACALEARIAAGVKAS